jgi:deoxyribodipyrimidine photo-lyase
MKQNKRLIATLNAKFPRASKEGIDLARVRILRQGPLHEGLIAYWMSRDQRIRDNWALLFAQELALKERLQLAVVFCLVPRFLQAGLQQYRFMLEGLRKVERDLADRRIPFFLLLGQPEREIPRFLKRQSAGVLVTDFDPLKIKCEWKSRVSHTIDIPFYEVDTHNILPCWAVTDKQEYAAYTFRPKVKRLLPQFLEEFPPLKEHPRSWNGEKPNNSWEDAHRSLNVDKTPRPVDWLQSGEEKAQEALKDFLQYKLQRYHLDRNDPNLDGQSNLSPYLHFGQICSQRIALEVLRCKAAPDAKEAFLEELITRRELSDNFCYFNTHYDSFEGFPDWSKKSLSQHAKDEREYLYSLDQLERAQTHDPLWNAAQNEMVWRGKMHGYMRMYWGKKILEWSEDPDAALRAAIYLNDKYELDGRDPNGYAGIAWSIGGVHDRPWFERQIFGKVRYMSYGGCKSKFDVNAYIEKVNTLTADNA